MSAGIWYSDAVAWAASAELTGGYGDGRFGPTDAVTREQVAALLFRYAQLQKLELAADQSVPDFSDTASVSGWAKEAMDWAVRTGLLLSLIHIWAIRPTPTLPIRPCPWLPARPWI